VLYYCRYFKVDLSFYIFAIIFWNKNGQSYKKVNDNKYFDTEGVYFSWDSLLFFRTFFFADVVKKQYNALANDTVIDVNGGAVIFFAAGHSLCFYAVSLGIRPYRICS
jgi:hypothetical protein